MKVEIDIPPHLAWMIQYYQTKAEVRAQLPGHSFDMNAEFITALEQYAIQGIQQSTSTGLTDPRSP